MSDTWLNQELAAAVDRLEEAQKKEAESYGLTPTEFVVAKRMGTDPRLYAAMKNVHNIDDLKRVKKELALEEEAIERLRAEQAAAKRLAAE